MQQSALNEIWARTDEDWFDLNLTITSIEEDSEYLVVIGKGLFRGKLVGLKVAFSKGLKPGLVGSEIDKNVFIRKGIIFSTIGSESDELLRAISTLYQVKIETPIFAPCVETTAFALEEKQFDFKKDYVRFKVFFNDQAGEDEYAELFTNIDLENRRLELHEKDSDYRNNVVHAFTGNLERTGRCPENAQSSEFFSVKRIILGLILLLIIFASCWFVFSH